ncbi:MAG TPA: AsnC family transcriptional regulator [Thermomicrobiales bacterium]|nr:AsnC family transcriptional regulator [Thermomicrobiales bacterium]
MDELDQQLLNVMQNDFPLTGRPFAALGEPLGLGEDEVIARVARLVRGNIIRQISAIFDTRSLGYQSCLVAMRIPPDRLVEGALVVNTHPGVTHNYKRNHEYNLWFTVAVPPGHDLAGTVARLQELAGAEQARMLPTLRLFKIGVDLDLTGKRAAGAQAQPHYSDARRSDLGPQALNDGDIAIIRELQENLPLVAEPYTPMAARLGLDLDALFARLAELKAIGHFRRMAAVLYHRKAGFKANAMAVWKVPDERMDDLGPVFGSFRSVSHCYQRPTYEDWPYSVFTMIHGRTPDECQAVIDAIEERTGVREYATLYSSTEFKKTRLRYFTPELDEWEARYLSGAPATVTAD